MAAGRYPPKLNTKKSSIEAPADPRELPAYGISEAAHYLRIPLATLRSWVRGRFYPTEAGKKYFEPIITLPDPKLAALSFVNLVEAHVLDAIRREHHVPFPNVRSAVNYVQRQFHSKHPLAEQKFETDGINLFVSRFEKLVSVSEEGQLAMRELIKAHLRRIEHDASGFAVRLFPFTRKHDLDQPKIVVIDPFVSFGRPTITGMELLPAFWPSDIKRAIQWTRWPKIMVANAPKSKKRSAASSPSPPEQLVFFTDENLGRHTVPEAVRLAQE